MQIDIAALSNWALASIPPFLSCTRPWLEGWRGSLLFIRDAEKHGWRHYRDVWVHIWCCCLGYNPPHHPGPAVSPDRRWALLRSPVSNMQNTELLYRLRWAQVETLCFTEWMFGWRNWFSVMFTALGIVFSCTFCILKPFLGVQCSLYKHKGKTSQQFRLLLSYSAEIINSEQSPWSFTFSPPGAGVEPSGPKLRALWLFKSPLDQ